MTYKINFQSTLSHDEQEVLWAGIEKAIPASVGKTGRRELCFLLRDEQGQNFGGMRVFADCFQLTHHRVATGFELGAF